MVSFQDVIFNITLEEQSHFLSLFKCPLTHIIPKGEIFRERTKLYHSLFPHQCPLNSLVRFPDQDNLIEQGIKIIWVLPRKSFNISS